MSQGIRFFFLVLYIHEKQTYRDRGRGRLREGNAKQIAFEISVQKRKGWLF